jgi:hypothetical protein
VQCAVDIAGEPDLFGKELDGFHLLALDSVQMFIGDKLSSHSNVRCPLAG